MEALELLEGANLGYVVLGVVGLIALILAGIFAYRVQKRAAQRRAAARRKAFIPTPPQAGPELQKEPPEPELEFVLAPGASPAESEDHREDMAAARDLEAEREQVEEPAPKALSSALEKTRENFFGRLKLVFSRRERLSADELEDLEEVLYTSDLGPQTVQRLMQAVEDRMSANGGSGFEAVRTALKDEMLEIFEALPNGQIREPAVGLEHVGLERLNIWEHKPAVIMIVGVNGAGKTTTIGKLANRIAQQGKKVVVAAGDTFRAAAGEQLKAWTDRAQVEIFHPPGVTDPSAVAYDACNMAKSRGFDVVIVDTAGRLHTQKNLMEELKKMKRVIDKITPGAPHEVLLVLDANSGQNALIQAREFHTALGVTGVVLTKLDGTAKGGVAVGVACELQIPIKVIGVGEGINDLRAFQPQEFVDSII